MITIILGNSLMLSSLLSAISITLVLAVKKLAKIPLANQYPLGFTSIGWNG